MRVFNFYQFVNELVSNKFSIEEQQEILKDIINDLYEMETSDDVRRRPHTDIDVLYGYIILRSPMTLEPGQTVEVRPTNKWPSIEFEDVDKAQFGFSIRIGRSLVIQKIKSRALEIFKRQTGISLSTMESDEGYLIMADSKVISFIESILLFEEYLSDIELYMSPKYQDLISIDASDPLKISIKFEIMVTAGLSIEGTIKLNIERGFVLGDSNTINGIERATNENIPVGGDVKYRISSISGSYKDGTFGEFYDKIKNLKFTFDIDVYDNPDNNVKLFYDVIEKNIISLYRNEVIELREKIEDELDNLSKYHISSEYTYSSDVNIIEVDLDWKEENYQFNVVVTSPNVIIQQFGKTISTVDIESLSESIYLLLMDGKLKITQ